MSSPNEAQHQVIDQSEGPMMVLAGAGSGKTRTLVSKINYLLENKMSGRGQILALTFSNRAAKEMRERIKSQVQAPTYPLVVSTFHGFCSSLLRREGNYLGIGKNFTIYDRSESKSIAKTLIEQAGYKLKDFPPQELLYVLDSYKNEGYYWGRENLPPDIFALDPFVPDFKDEYTTFFRRYEEELSKSNAVDFGGLITATLELFERHPEVLKRVQNQYQYILVDEYQDTNRAQFELIVHLAGEKKNLCVVGDEDQSIYSWRGADIRNILEFDEVFPQARVFKLEQNYRSTKTIIDAAGYLIANNQARKGKNMWTANEAGDAIRVYECIDDRHEAKFLAGQIRFLLDGGVSPWDIAVFYRANSQSRALEEQLRQAHIPFKIIGGIGFYERKEIKDVLAYLKLLINPKDSLSLSRIINTPPRGIGAITMRRFEELALSLNVSLWEAILQVSESEAPLGEIKLSKKAKVALNEFVQVILHGMEQVKKARRPSDIYQDILQGSGLLAMLEGSRDYENKARLENLQELLSAIRQFEELNPKGTLESFLEGLTLDVSFQLEELEEEDHQKKKGEVSLMTIHGAKGLEFPYVFVVGAEESVFPSYQSLENGEMAIEEERRLFYVAMTRAMKELVILFANGRMLFGNVRFNAPSRFLLEVPNQYYLWKKADSPALKTGKTQSFLETKSNGLYENQKFSYDVGVKVKHDLYGVGVIQDCSGHGADEKVTIVFPGGVKKKFMVKFAPLSLAD